MMSDNLDRNVGLFITLKKDYPLLHAMCRQPSAMSNDSRMLQIQDLVSLPVWPVESGKV